MRIDVIKCKLKKKKNSPFGKFQMGRKIAHIVWSPHGPGFQNHKRRVFVGRRGDSQRASVGVLRLRCCQRTGEFRLVLGVGVWSRPHAGERSAETGGDGGTGRGVRRGNRVHHWDPVHPWGARRLIPLCMGKRGHQHAHTYARTRIHPTSPGPSKSTMFGMKIKINNVWHDNNVLPGSTQRLCRLLESGSPFEGKRNNYLGFINMELPTNAPGY